MNGKILKIVCYSLLVCLLGATFGQAQEDPKIAVIDFMKLRDSSAEVQSFTRSMQNKTNQFVTRKEQLENEMKSLLKDMQYLNEGSEEHSTMRQLLVEKNSELKVIRHWVDQGLQREEVRFFESFFFKTSYACEDYALQNDLTMIFRLAPQYDSIEKFQDANVRTPLALEHIMDVSFDLYYNPEIDITEDIVKLMDKKFGLEENFQDQRVSMIYDAYGTPHIFGADDESAFYGWGQLQAKLRLPGLMKNYLTARGEMAMHFGEDWLPSDQRAKLFRIDELAEMQWLNLPVVVTRPIELFCMGINDTIRRQRKTLPAWIRSVSPRDVVSFMLYLQMRQAWAQAYGDVDPMTASMAMVGGPKTAPLETMFLAEVATPQGEQWEWVEAGLHGHSMSVFGATLPGLPYMLIAHNDSVAWGFGGNRADTVDVFHETINANRTQYLFEGVWRPLLRNTITVQVKQSDGTLRKEQQISYETEHGPVIQWQERNGDAVRIAGVSATVLSALYRLHIAPTCVQASDALIEDSFPRSQFMYCDTLGNMAYLYSAAIPERDTVLDWSKPVDGSKTLSDWGVLRDILDLPNEYNPTSGYFVSDNDAPWAVTQGADINAFPPDTLIYRGPERSDFNKQLGARFQAAETVNQKQFQSWCSEAVMANQRRKHNDQGMATGYSLLVHAKNGILTSASALQGAMIQAAGVTKKSITSYISGEWKSNATKPVDVFNACHYGEGQRITFGHPLNGYVIELRLRERHKIRYDWEACPAAEPFEPVTNQVKVSMDGEPRGECDVHFMIPKSEAGHETELRVFSRSPGGNWELMHTRWDKRSGRMSATIPLPEAAVLGRMKLDD